MAKVLECAKVDPSSGCTHVVRGKTEEELFVFLLFGFAFVPAAAPHWDIAAVGYALGSLTLVRMLPVWLCLAGSGLPPATKLFIGWSGPRGIASVLYVAIVVQQFGLAGHERVLAVVVLGARERAAARRHGGTAVGTVFAHGTAARGSPPAEDLLHPDAHITSARASSARTPRFP